MPDKTISLRVGNCMPEIYGRQKDCLLPTSYAYTKPNNRTARCTYYRHVNTFHGGETSPTSFHFTSNSNFRLRADKPQNVRYPEDVRVDSATKALTFRCDAYRLNETNSPTRAIESEIPRFLLRCVTERNPALICPYCLPGIASNQNTNVTCLRKTPRLIMVNTASFNFQPCNGKIVLA